MVCQAWSSLFSSTFPEYSCFNIPTYLLWPFGSFCWIFDVCFDFFSQFGKFAGLSSHSCGDSAALWAFLLLSFCWYIYIYFFLFISAQTLFHILWSNYITRYRLPSLLHFSPLCSSLFPHSILLHLSSLSPQPISTLLFESSTAGKQLVRSSLLSKLNGLRNFPSVETVQTANVYHHDHSKFFTSLRS